MSNLFLLLLRRILIPIASLRRVTDRAWVNSRTQNRGVVSRLHLLSSPRLRLEVAGIAQAARLHQLRSALPLITSVITSPMGWISARRND